MITFKHVVFEAESKNNYFFAGKLLFALNPFVPNAPFLYPLKTSENLTVFLCFQGAEKGCIGNEWVKIFHFFFVSNHSINFDTCDVTMSIGSLGGVYFGMYLLNRKSFRSET